MTYGPRDFTSEEKKQITLMIEKHGFAEVLSLLAQMSRSSLRVCMQCQNHFFPTRTDKQYCSDFCRGQALRHRRKADKARQKGGAP